MNKLHFALLDSTNNYLKDNYKSLDNYTFVSTDSQSNGRGRNNRKWISENGKNLLFSLLLLDKQFFDSFKEISILTAYAIIKELELLGLNNLKIKWPNDIYIDNKKVCGILLEAVSTDKMECLIVGVGLNVNETLFQNEYRVEPTSLRKELNKEIDIDDLKEKIYNALINVLNDIKNGVDYYNCIDNYDYLKGRYAKYNNSDVLIKGIAKDYSLKIILNGNELSVDADEIVL